MSAEKKIHECLANGPKTADEIAEITGINLLTVRPRITAMQKRGLVEYYGIRRENSTGSQTKVFQLKQPVLYGECQPAIIYEEIPKTVIFSSKSPKLKSKPNTISDEYTCQVHDLPIIETPPRCQHILDLIKECNPRELSFLKLYFQQYRII